MRLLVMIVCALAAIVLFASEAFGDLHGVWAHPEHKPIDNDARRSRLRR